MKKYNIVFGANKKYTEKKYNVYRSNTLNRCYVLVHSDEDVHKLCDGTWPKEKVNDIIDSLKDYYEGTVLIRPAKVMSNGRIINCLQRMRYTESNDNIIDKFYTYEASINAKDFNLEYWKKHNYLPL